MTNKDIEKMLNECDGLDMSHIKKDDVLAKAKQEMYFNTEPAQQAFRSSACRNRSCVNDLRWLDRAL